MNTPNWFIYPWRVEGRQTPFHPWAVLSEQQHLRVAVAEAVRVRKAWRFYATRVRVNA